MSIFTGAANAQVDYESEIELEYGVPTLISEISVPPGNIFVGQVIEGLFIKANFSNNNGSIWIKDQINDTIWQDYLNEKIETYINTNSSSILSYCLWANSSTLGNNTLYYTFTAKVFQAENFALGISIILIPMIIIGAIIYGIASRKKKESYSVRVARRIGERMRLKYGKKYQEKEAQKYMELFCPKCGAKAQHPTDNFCKECGFKLRG